MPHHPWSGASCSWKITATSSNFTQRQLLDGRYKFVFNAFDFDELYDLETDPHELHNLAQDRSHRDTYERLADRLWDWIADARRPYSGRPYAATCCSPAVPHRRSDPTHNHLQRPGAECSDQGGASGTCQAVGAQHVAPVPPPQREGHSSRPAVRLRGYASCSSIHPENPDADKNLPQRASTVGDERRSGREGGARRQEVDQFGDVLGRAAALQTASSPPESGRCPLVRSTSAWPQTPERRRSRGFPAPAPRPSSASRRWTAALDAQYGMELPTGLNAETEEILMIAPFPCSFIGAATALEAKYTP